MASSTSSTTSAAPMTSVRPSMHTFNRAKSLYDLILAGYPIGCDPKRALKLRLEVDCQITLCPPLVHLVAQKLDFVALNIFLEKGAFCDIPDATGNTPLKILTQKIIERPGDNEILKLVCAFIKKGARLDAADHLGETPLSDILLSGNEDLFSFCLTMEAPWAHAFIALCRLNDETSSLLEPRLERVLAQQNAQKELINELLRLDFSEHSNGLVFLLRHALANIGYQPPWLDILRKEATEPSLRCKLDILKECGFMGPLRKHFFGLKFDQNREYAVMREWFEEQATPFTRTAPIPIPPPRVESKNEHSDYLRKGNSWSHQSPPRHPLRQRGTSVNSTESFIDPERLVQQFEQGSDAEKRLAQVRIKSLLPVWVVSSNINEKETAKKFLEKNPAWINRKLDGQYLLIRTVESNGYEMAHFLLQHCADANIWGDKGDTPLHLVLRSRLGASVEESVKLIQHLLKRGANLDRLNQQSETPIDLLFIRCEAALFGAFEDVSIDWSSILKKKIENGIFKGAGASACLNYLITHGKVSPKTTAIWLLERTWSEKDGSLSLLECALKRCEKMEMLELEALSKDASEESVVKKLDLLARFPVFFERLLNFLLESPQPSHFLLKLMIAYKPVGVKPNYTLIFENTDKKVRARKLRILMDLDLIPESKKVEEWASGKTMKFAEAFQIGLLSLAPDLNGINWSEQLKGACVGVSTLTELQRDFLERSLPKAAAEVAPIVTMLFQQDFCRSDPLKPNPYETILELVIPFCNSVSDEQVNCLLNDKMVISYDRKRAICERNAEFNKCLSSLLSKKAQEENSLRSSSSTTKGRHSGHKSSKSLPNSGESSPRRHRKKS